MKFKIANNLNIYDSFTDIFPKDWKIVRLGEIGEFSKGSGISKNDIAENGIPCIRYGELYTTYKEIINFVYCKTNLPKSNLILSEKNDILIPTSGETAIDIATASCIMQKGVAIGGDITIIKTNQNGHYVAYCLNNTMKRHITSLAQGATIIHLYPYHLKSLYIPLPPLWEQEKIAKILSAADCLIQNTQALITQKERYKKGLCQKLFSQKLRFKGFKDKWKETKLGEVLEESNLRNTELKINKVLSVTNSLGFVSQEEYFQRNIASKNLANYKIIYNGDFAYNPARINVGSIALLDNFLNGILSPMYIVFKCLNIDKYFLKYWLDSFLFKGILHRFLSGSVRQTLNFNEMKQMPIKLPSLKEQQKIAEFLNLYDKEIDLLKEKLLLLKNQKQALMQQLLSGKVRVKR